MKQDFNTWTPKIELDAFIDRYAANSSNQTRSGILEWLVPLPCTCDEDGCDGWAMISKNPASMSWHNYSDGFYFDRFSDKPTDRAGQKDV